MNKLTFILFALITATQLSSAKDTRPDLAASLIPETLKKNAYAVIRQNEVVFEYNTPEKGIMTEKTTITILDEKGKDYGDFAYPGDKYRTLGSFEGAVYDAQGNLIRKLKKSDINSSEWSEYLATGDLHYFLEIAPTMYPYTVSYEYTIDFKNGILMFPSFFPQQSANVSVLCSNYILKVPENTKIDVKAFNAESLKKIKTEKGFDIYTAEVKDLSAFENEPFMPDHDSFLPFILSRPQNFVYDKNPGEITDWKSLGKWEGMLWNNRDVLNENTIQKIKELTSSASSDYEKIKILYDFLGKNTHYQNISLGIGGYQPMPASEVSRIGFGDCKGLSNYLHAMLKAIGIKSYVAAIQGTESTKNVIQDYANFTQFNHIILYVPLQNKPLWLECTNTEVPFGFIHNSIAGHQALLFKEDGGELVRLPDYPDSLNIDKNVSKITLNADGSAVANSMNYSYLKVYDDFYSFTKKKYNEQVDNMRQMIKLPNASINKVSFTEEKKEQPLLSVQIDWNTNAYGTKTGTRLFLPVNPLRKGEYNFKKKERKFDIEILDGQRNIDSLTLVIPQNYIVETLPAPAAVRSSFGKFDSKVIVTGNVITIYQSLLLHNGNWKANTYPDLLAFFEKVNDAYKAKIVIKNKE